MKSFSGKNVLVAGGTGLIGSPLVELLISEGASVRIASMDDPSRAHPESEFRRVDLLSFDNCAECCRDMDYVFNLLCVKGSPAVTTRRPASFLVSHLRFNTNLMEAARQCRVGGFLFTSSLAVYSPSPVFREDDVWKTFPSDNDRFAGWAKRMGELQAEAYAIEYGWTDIAVARPANTYGPFDNFGLENAMVIPSLIRKVVDGEDPLTVWGDGSQRRDFFHARDAAAGLLAVARSEERRPVNIGSGKGVSIAQLVEVILANTTDPPRVDWDTSKPSGDHERVLDISRARAIGFEPEISLAEGIASTMEWYRQHGDAQSARYDVFSEGPRANHSRSVDPVPPGRNSVTS